MGRKPYEDRALVLDGRFLNLSQHTWDRVDALRESMQAGGVRVAATTVIELAVERMFEEAATRTATVLQDHLAAAEVPPEP